MTPETALVKAVIAYLNARGAFAWRNNSGLLRGEHKGKPWAVHMGLKGLPDVIGVLPSAGRLIAVECKRGTNQPSRDQERVMKELTQRGALVIVAHDIRDVAQAFV